MGAAAFGTSGLRGITDAFTSTFVASYVQAFLEIVCAEVRSRQLLIGMDLRHSSPEIAAHVANAAKALGWVPINGGNVPTPALAAFAMAKGSPAIMITGSHIPADYNGLKFYTPAGELLKSHEAPIRERAEALLSQPADTSAPAGSLPPVALEVADFYRGRFLSSFSPDLLKGLSIGVFLHSAVGGDMLFDILENLGATVEPFGRSDAFVAVDTEAVAQDHLDLMVEMVRAHGLDAVISTDGDGDRPLVLDEQGRQINGDVLGALAARALGANCVVTPLTSTTALEHSNWFSTIRRTRIGSPYVVAEMVQAATEGLECIVGFEANGGFLTQDDIELEAGVLPALSTRDAITPILAVLGEVRLQQSSLSKLAAHLPQRFMRADRLKDVSPERGLTFIKSMAEDVSARTGFDQTLAFPIEIDTTDGTRLILSDDVVVHFRQSGNAPELRCYVETDSELGTATLLQTMMRRLAVHFGQG